MRFIHATILICLQVLIVMDCAGSAPSQARPLLRFAETVAGQSGKADADTTSNRLAAISADGKIYAFIAMDGTIRVHDAGNEELPKVPSKNGAEITSLALNKDGSLLAAGFNSGDVRVWIKEKQEKLVSEFQPYKLRKMENSAATPPVKPGKSPILSLAFDSEDKLATCDQAGFLDIFSITAGKPKWLKTLPKNTAIVSLAFYEKTPLSLLGADNEGTIRIYSENELPRPISIPNKAVRISIDPVHSLLVVCGADNRVQTWMLNPLKQTGVLTYASPIKTVSFAPDSNILFVDGSNSKDQKQYPVDFAMVTSPVVIEPAKEPDLKSERAHIKQVVEHIKKAADNAGQAKEMIQSEARKAEDAYKQAQTKLEAARRNRRITPDQLNKADSSFRALEMARDQASEQNRTATGLSAKMTVVKAGAEVAAKPVETIKEGAVLKFLTEQVGNADTDAVRLHEQMTTALKEAKKATQNLDVNVAALEAALKPAAAFALDVAAKPALLGKIAHAAEVTGVAFNPEKMTQLVTSTQDGKITFWDKKGNGTGYQSRPDLAHTKIANAVAFSPDGKFVASGGADNQIRIHDLTTRDNKFLTSPHNNKTVRSVTFDTNSDLLVSGGSDGRVLLTDMSNSDMPVGTSQALSGVLFASVDFSPDGQYVAGGGLDGTIYVWSVGDLRNKNAAPKKKLSSGADLTKVYSITFISDTTLASVGLGKTVVLWDLESGKVIKRLTGATNDLFSVAVRNYHGITLLAAGGVDKKIRLWDISDLKSVKGPLVIDQHTDAIRTLAFSRDGSQLASGSFDKSVVIWDVASFFTRGE